MDLDGTLIHTTVDFTRMKERMIVELEGRGVPRDVMDPRQTVAINMSRVHQHLASTGREAEWGEVEAMVTEMMERTEMEKVHLTRPVDGAREVILELRRRGYRVALLTRGSRRYATAALRYAGLEGLLEEHLFRDDYPEREAKPNGIALRRIAERLGVRPEECLLVGDHSMDLHCARASRGGFAGVLTGAFREEDWRREGCPCVISSVGEVLDLLRTD
jgi:phosphoglycolate phosphatase